jgi:hypothetical protein
MSAPTITPTLRDRIASAVGEGDLSETVVLAGHFAIFTAGGRATDFLDNASPVAGHTDMVSFTRSTWTAAIDVLSKPAFDDARLLVLVDDLQFVRPALPDRGARERLGAALSADYLRRTPTLPAYHARELESRGIDAARVVKNENAAWLFSERALRHAAVERIRGAASHGANGQLVINADESRIVVRDAEFGEHTIVHSGHTTCAGGYLELVLRLHERGIRRLVALVPSRCLGPVTLGAALARSLFGAAGIEVVNLTD